jgi:cysteine desulfurase
MLYKRRVLNAKVFESKRGDLMYYFDSVSAKKPHPGSIEAFYRAQQKHWAHPASVHQLGQNLVRELKGAYEDLAYFYSATPEQTIVFGSSLQEMIAQVIQGIYLAQSRQSGKNHFLCSCLDEAPIILNLEKLTPLGCSHELIPATSKGQIDLIALEKAIQPRTALIAVSWANALTGVIQPIAEIAKLANEREIPLLIDASPTMGLYALNLSDLQPNYVCFSGNSLGAPVGSACCWYREDCPFVPLITSGHDWMHSSSCNPPALLALAYACKQSLEERDEAIWKLVQLRNYFEAGLKKHIPAARVMFENCERIVNVTAIGFEGIHAEFLAWHLNRKQVYTTFGGGTRQQLHYLLKACQVESAFYHSCLSFSLDLSMTYEFLDEAIALITQCYDFIKTMHHFQTDSSEQNSST